MKRWIVCGLLLAWPVCAWSQQVVRSLPVVLQLDVNAQGQVTSAKVVKRTPGGIRVDAQAAGLAPKLAQAVTRTASKWRFKAPQLHGHAVPGRTFAFTDMKILKLADGSYRLDLEYLRNGPVFMPRQMPGYPARMRRLGYGGAVVVEAKVLPDGTIAHAHVVKTFTVASDHGRAFAKAALDFVRHGKGVPMQLDGRAVTTLIRMPIYYQLGGGDNPEKAYGKQVHALMEPKDGTDRLHAPVRPNSAIAMDSPFVREPQG